MRELIQMAAVNDAAGIETFLKEHTDFDYRQRMSIDNSERKANLISIATASGSANVIKLLITGYNVAVSDIRPDTIVMCFISALTVYQEHEDVKIVRANVAGDTSAVIEHNRYMDCAEAYHLMLTSALGRHAK